DNTFVYDTDDVYCVWQNAFCEKDGSVEISLDFFKSQKNGTYLREQESFCEYIYDDEFLTQCIKQGKMSVIARYDDFTFNSVNDKTQRIVYVCRKESI
ncbi:MAG: class I SAM-dependent methyltransferase, partial [Oscillospiraceae bacterium]|nr:class I SAM-dependent methyltransferase [Oscillospiraceae bacterium]